MLRNGKFFRVFMKDESGNILILVAFMMVVLLGASVLAVDAGSLYQTRRQTVNAADAAALAGAQEIIRAHQAGITDDAGVNSAVTAKVTSYLGYHEAVLVEVTDQDGNPIKANSKTVKVNAKKEADLFFVPAFYALAGAQSTGSEVSAIATARIEYVTKVYGGIHPFALHSTLWGFVNEDDPFFTMTLQFEPGKAPKDGDEYYNPWGSGNWGTVNFDSKGASNPKLANWIENGYEGENATLNATIYSSPSTNLNSGPCQDAIETQIGNVLIVPVVSGEPNGSGELTIIGFAAIELIGVEGKGANMELQAKLITKEFDISQLSSIDPQYDFGLHSATLIE